MAKVILIFILRKVMELLGSWLVFIQSFYLLGLLVDYKFGNLVEKPLIHPVDYWAFGFCMLFCFAVGILCIALVIIGFVALVKWNWEKAEEEADF